MQKRKAKEESHELYNETGRKERLEKDEEQDGLEMVKRLMLLRLWATS